MKNFTLVIAIAAFSLTASAHESISPAGNIPRVYFMMRHGRLVEMYHGHKRLVKKDVMLVNSTTIHPNGAIDAGSGQSLQLKEGQYMTTDGRIRLLKDMGRIETDKPY
jgi:hypothetical protein